MNILVSGFAPFLGQTVNPSALIAKSLAVEFSAVTSIILPVEYKNAFTVLHEKIMELNPDFILLLGQARNRPKICLEKVAINWIYSQYADEKNTKPAAGPIVPDSDLALMTSVPLEKMFADDNDFNISFSAGTYVCNELYYQVLHHFTKTPSLFVHLPLLPEQILKNDVYSMDYNEQLRVIKKLVHRLGRN